MISIKSISCLAPAAAAGLFFASAPAWSASNGYGPDADGDSNPAINTLLLTRIGDAAEAALDPPFKIITFEKPHGHGDIIRNEYKAAYGVTFSRGLTRQICEGQRYFQYNTQCTYLRAPSGRYAAVYRDDYNRPLRIRFDNPVCAAALAVYPTGGEEGERYRVVLQPYAEDGAKLKRVTERFTWTNDTFRWRLMTSAYFLGRKASRVDVSVLGRRRQATRFLIDDVAFIADGCEQTLEDVAAETAAPASSGAYAFDDDDFE